MIGETEEPRSVVSKACLKGEEELSIRRLLRKYFSSKLKES
jgi:hypothetical protein